MNNRCEEPIGVFDSGLGGLTVVKELIHHLPNERIVYFGDTARVPYGTKSAETIIRYSREIVRVLLKHKVKMVVVACNTASSLALDALKKEFNVPIFGVIEPGARKALQVTRNKKIGIIATSSTVKSGKYAQKIVQLDKDVFVTSQSCPLFVPLVEEGWFDHAVTYQVAQQYLGEMKKKKISQTEMAKRIGTSRAALMRLLNPENYSVTLLTLYRAAAALGKDLEIRFQ